MDQKGFENELKNVNEQLESLRKKRIELLGKIAEKEIPDDYTFANADGTTIKFSELFGDRRYLFVVHNMGKSCGGCTRAGDAFNGTFKQIEEKGAFVFITPDPIEAHKEFKEKQGWKFRSASCDGTTFARDVDFWFEGKGNYPGISVFEKLDDGKIKRVSKDYFGPTDYSNNSWQVIDLLPTEDIN
jgi:predicted dithiol-disulfide oxidoreductase (DUF899 family)